jgi:hypothetical protein
VPVRGQRLQQVGALAGDGGRGVHRGPPSAGVRDLGRR